MAWGEVLGLWNGRRRVKYQRGTLLGRGDVVELEVERLVTLVAASCIPLAGKPRFRNRSSGKVSFSQMGTPVTREGGQRMAKARERKFSTKRPGVDGADRRVSALRSRVGESCRSSRSRPSSSARFSDHFRRGHRLRRPARRSDGVGVDSDRRAEHQLLRAFGKASILENQHRSNDGSAGESIASVRLHASGVLFMGSLRVL